VAGEGSSSGDTTLNSATFDFTHTASWNGPGTVLDPDGLNPSTSFNVSSNSGFNYNAPYSAPSEVPEPGTAGLGAVAVAAFALWKRRRTA
jgi:MYXO-CTERM domain-containing protein